MGASSDFSDFYILASGEPHVLRRKAILEKYGDQVRPLFGNDNNTGYQVLMVVCIQIFIAWSVRQWSWGPLLLLAYVLGRTLNQNLFLGQHELSHHLGYKTPIYNRLMALVANLPMGVPMCVAFRKYHQEHHAGMGLDELDMDLPTPLEARWVDCLPLKILYATWYMIVYAIRPLLLRPKPADLQQVINWVVVIAFDIAVLKFFGMKSLVYLLGSSTIGGILHPIAGHMVAEHYMFAKGQETYSYYGWANAITYNVGYHVEHHDFPMIPHSRLHKLRQIAPEFYDTLLSYDSWTKVIWMFLSDPEVGPWARIRRASGKHTGPGADAQIGKPTAALLAMLDT